MESKNNELYQSFVHKWERFEKEEFDYYRATLEKVEEGSYVVAQMIKSHTENVWRARYCEGIGCYMLSIEPKEDVNELVKKMDEWIEKNKPFTK